MIYFLYVLEQKHDSETGLKLLYAPTLFSASMLTYVQQHFEKSVAFGSK